MKTIRGKKFCTLCSEPVFDVRKKTGDKIFQLHKEKGTCCMIIYDYQLEALEEKILSEKILKTKKRNRLATAAALTALSLNPLYSTSTKKPAELFVSRSHVKISGSTANVSQPGNKLSGRDTLAYHGKIISDGIDKASNVELRLGYQGVNKFIVVITFISDENENFTFTLSPAQYKECQGKQLTILGKNKPVRRNTVLLNGEDIKITTVMPKKHVGKKCAPSND